MTSLSPKQAATIAKHVYAVRQESDMNTVLELSGGLGIRDQFEVDKTSRFQGTSGPLIFSKKSGFGYAARGIGTHRGEALVVIRGTATARDWLTDANCGLQRGSGGFVHAGFNDTFKSFVGELRQFFAKHDTTHAHCVGHSLGGALATLTADYLVGANVSGVSLYTFGSPRVGELGFSRHLTKRVDGDNIYRVYHDADPVSMIPIFPFIHVPDPGPGVQLRWSGSRVSVPAHYMDSYIGTLGDGGWAGLKASSGESAWAQGIEAWLDSAASGGIVMFSAHTLWMVRNALQWILKKAAIGIVGLTLAAGVTVLDQLAWLLYQGAVASKEIAEGLVSLIRVIFRFLGRPIGAVVNISVAFVRWVLDLLQSSLTATVHRALNLIPFQ
jgi:pimeloyl-ACP methyl ester carboxylesterase